jgi:hypothetical protein
VTEAGVLLVQLLVDCIVLQIVRQKNYFFASFPQLESLCWKKIHTHI